MFFFIIKLIHQFTYQWAGLNQLCFHSSFISFWIFILVSLYYIAFVSFLLSLKLQWWLNEVVCYPGIILFSFPGQSWPWMPPMAFKWFSSPQYSFSLHELSIYMVCRASANLLPHLTNRFRVDFINNFI